MHNTFSRLFLTSSLKYVCVINVNFLKRSDLSFVPFITPLKGLSESPNYFNNLVLILGGTARVHLCLERERGETHSTKEGFAPVLTSEPHTLTWPLGGAGEICLGFANTYLILP